MKFGALNLCQNW